MEATYLDYKESLETTKPVSWLKSVVAFANTKGGHIIFGVTDEEHKFIGIDNLQRTSSKISEFISTRVSPWPRFTLTPIDSEYPDKKCIDLEVAPGPDYPYYYINTQEHAIFMRHGDRSEKATPIEQNNLLPDLKLKCNTKC